MGREKTFESNLISMLNWIHPKRDDALNILLEDEFIVTKVPGIKYFLEFVDQQMANSSKFHIFADFQNSYLLANYAYTLAIYYLPGKLSVSTIGNDTKVTWTEANYYLVKDKYNGELLKQIKDHLNIKT